MMKNNTLFITKTAIVIALVGLLGLTPVGFIYFGNLQITTVHLVVILIAILLGRTQAIIAGATFGVTSLITAITTATIFSPIFLNPLVSIVPRILLGLVAYYLFQFCLFLFAKVKAEKTKYSIAAIITAIVATFIHTVLVVALIWVFKWLSPELTSEILNVTLLAILSINLPAEIAVAAVGSGLVVPVLYPYFNKRNQDGHKKVTS